MCTLGVNHVPGRADDQYAPFLASVISHIFSGILIDVTY